MIVEDAPDKTVTDLFAMVRGAYASLQEEGSNGFSFPILTMTVRGPSPSQQYCTALYCPVLYCTVRYCPVLYGTVLLRAAPR